MVERRASQRRERDRRRNRANGSSAISATFPPSPWTTGRIRRRRLDHRGRRRRHPVHQRRDRARNVCGSGSGSSERHASRLAAVDFRVFVEPQQGATYADQLAVARAAEALGYSAFFRSDHYVAMSGDGLPGPTDSWVTLAGIARETSTIRLGTMVTSATFRYPGPLAISVAQVDEMSGGRVEFGIGAGWFEAEHPAYAIPFPPLGERFDRLTEQLEIITGLWTTPGRRDVRLRRQRTTPSPTPRRCPSLCSPRIRRSSSAAAAPSAPRRWRRSSPPSSTCRSCRWTSLKTQYDRVGGGARRQRAERRTR